MSDGGRDDEFEPSDGIPDDSGAGESERPEGHSRRDPASGGRPTGRPIRPDAPRRSDGPMRHDAPLRHEAPRGGHRFVGGREGQGGRGFGGREHDRGEGRGRSSDRFDDTDRSFHRSAMAIDPLPLVPDDLSRLPKAIVRTAIRHPSIYRKRIDHVDRHARPGDWVRVETAEGEPLGFGLFNPKSEITIRIVFGPERELTEGAWEQSLDRAVSMRRDLLRLDADTDAYRVVHAEGDGLPGLVVDRFGDVLSAEVFSVGMWRRIDPILRRLESMLGTRRRIARTAPHVLAQEGFDAPPLTGATTDAEGRGGDARVSDVTIREFGTRFRVRFAEAHKTGFFCDQRDNRRMLAGFCRDRTVLDLCCYSGGFSVQAKKLGQAADVIGVDLDEAPLEVAKENANLNQVRVRFVQADVFPFMRDMLRSGRQFDVVVLDPPKLIRSRAELDEGTRKHFDLNRLAMQLVAPGGLLLSCTCAGLLPGDDFYRLLCSAARQAGDPIGEAVDGEFRRRGPRGMRFLTKTGAAADHPVASNCPESEYLHAAWMRLD